MPKSHKDVEFHVESGEATGRYKRKSDAYQGIFKTFDEAAGNALGLALSRGETVYIDVVVWSEKVA